MSSDDNLCLMKSCFESSAACLECAERSGSHEGCATQCRINAELAGVTARLMSLKAPEVNTLVDLVIKSSKKCADICSQHKNDHCQACAAAARNLGNNLRGYQERAAG
ncbi:22711_t:CDS:2 [Dentiscutata erythropus]|uniref:22711_t:CDS:1 n=1 Tax=Dentiscutata erythropus TaxID=1348616 RepID=A0A9N9BUI3_9GLOM|nr:22711_t:CDS:2 [Dentiscutata erythropus]